MPKPYELTDDEYCEAINNARAKDCKKYGGGLFPILIIPSSLEEIAIMKAAQKKLVEYLIKDAVSTKHQDWPDIISRIRHLLKDFGL